MSLQTWNEVYASENAAGANFPTFTTAKTVLPTGCLVTLPANWWYVGRKIRVTAMMAISNIVTTPGTITFQVNHGAIATFTTGAIQLNATAHTLLPAKFEALLTCRTVGSGTGAALEGMAEVNGVMFTRTAAQVDNVNVGSGIIVPVTAPANGTGFDSTIAQTLDFFCGFSISNAGNNVTVRQYCVEALN